MAKRSALEIAIDHINERLSQLRMTTQQKLKVDPSARSYLGISNMADEALNVIVGVPGWRVGYSPVRDMFPWCSSSYDQHFVCRMPLYHKSSQTPLKLIIEATWKHTERSRAIDVIDRMEVGSPLLGLPKWLRTHGRDERPTTQLHVAMATAAIERYTGDEAVSDPRVLANQAASKLLGRSVDLYADASTKSRDTINDACERSYARLQLAVHNKEASVGESAAVAAERCTDAYTNSYFGGGGKFTTEALTAWRRSSVAQHVLAETVRAEAPNLGTSAPLPWKAPTGPAEATDVLRPENPKGISLSEMTVAMKQFGFKPAKDVLRWEYTVRLYPDDYEHDNYDTARREARTRLASALRTLRGRFAGDVYRISGGDPSGEPDWADLVIDVELLPPEVMTPIYERCRIVANKAYAESPKPTVITLIVPQPWTESPFGKCVIEALGTKIRK